MCHVLIGTRRHGNFAHNICPSRRAFLETLSGYRFLTFDLHLRLWDRCWGGDTCHLSPFCPSLYIEGGKFHLLLFVFTELSHRRFPAYSHHHQAISGHHETHPFPRQTHPVLRETHPVLRETHPVLHRVLRRSFKVSFRLSFLFLLSSRHFSLC